jgi:hypothetical protein
MKINLPKSFYTQLKYNAEIEWRERLSHERGMAGVWLEAVIKTLEQHGYKVVKRVNEEALQKSIDFNQKYKLGWTEEEKTCGHCSEPCGNEWCPTLKEKGEASQETSNGIGKVNNCNCEKSQQGQFTEPDKDSDKHTE